MMKRNHRNKAAIKQLLKTLDWSITATIRNSHIMNHVQMNRYVSLLMQEHSGIERVFWCLEKDKSQLESHAHQLVKTKGKIDSIPQKIHRQDNESLLKFSIGRIQTAKTGLLITQRSTQASQISGTLLFSNSSSNKDFFCLVPIQFRQEFLYLFSLKRQVRILTQSLCFLPI